MGSFCIKEKTDSNKRAYGKVGGKHHSSTSPGEAFEHTNNLVFTLNPQNYLNNSGVCCMQITVLCCSVTSKLMQYFEQVVQMKITFHRRLTMLKKVVSSVRVEVGVGLVTTTSKMGHVNALPVDI